jgi:transposase-like protein
MGTIPTLVHDRAAPRLVDEVIAPRMASLARCENCGSPNVLSKQETSTAIYWCCQRCGELSATERISVRDSRADECGTRPAMCPFCQGKAVDTQATIVPVTTQWRCLECDRTWTIPSRAAVPPSFR